LGGFGVQPTVELQRFVAQGSVQAGSEPLVLNAHVPLVLPVSATTQDWQAPVQGWSQQTPSTQDSDAQQSLGVVHALPFWQYGSYLMACASAGGVETAFCMGGGRSSTQPKTSAARAKAKLARGVLTVIRSTMIFAR
jgi:hypothetical protein